MKLALVAPLEIVDKQIDTRMVQEASVLNTSTIDCENRENSICCQRAEGLHGGDQSVLVPVLVPVGILSQYSRRTFDLHIRKSRGDFPKGYTQSKWYRERERKREKKGKRKGGKEGERKYC